MFLAAGWNEWGGLWWPVLVKLSCILRVYLWHFWAVESFQREKWSVCCSIFSLKNVPVGGKIQFLIASLVSYWFIILLTCRMVTVCTTLVEDFHVDSNLGVLSNVLSRIHWEMLTCCVTAWFEVQNLEEIQSLENISALLPVCSSTPHKWFLAFKPGPEDL